MLAIIHPVHNRIITSMQVDAYELWTSIHRLVNESLSILMDCELMDDSCVLDRAPIQWILRLQYNLAAIYQNWKIRTTTSYTSKKILKHIQIHHMQAESNNSLFLEISSK